MKQIMIVLVIVLLSTSTAFAYDDQVQAQVTVVEPSYIPNKVYFQLNESSENCGWYIWNPSEDLTSEERIASIQAVHSALLAALISGREVRVHYFNMPGGNCSVEYFHSR